MGRTLGTPWETSRLGAGKLPSWLDSLRRGDSRVCSGRCLNGPACDGGRGVRVRPIGGSRRAKPPVLRVYDVSIGLSGEASVDIHHPCEGTSCRGAFDDAGRASYHIDITYRDAQFQLRKIPAAGSDAPHRGRPSPGARRSSTDRSPRRATGIRAARTRRPAAAAHPLAAADRCGRCPSIPRTSRGTIAAQPTRLRPT
jgi:hypothetical protein